MVGDGGFQMTMCELATIVQEQIDINVAIINNGYLGMVRQWQEFFYERRYAATPLVNPDFQKLAEAFGLPAQTVTQRQDVIPAVEAARKNRQTVVIDFKVEQEDTVYPMVPAGADLDAMIRRPSPIADHRNRRRRPVDSCNAETQDAEHPFEKSVARRAALWSSKRTIMITTFAIHVENKPGVLTRVSSLFRRRAFNIESLTVGHTDRPGVSRMTIVVDTDELGARRIEAHIYKLVNVLRVENITRRAGGVPRSRDDQGGGVGGIADAHHAARRCVSRAGRGRGARLAHHRDHRHRRQDRRPARSAAAVRRAGDGAHRPRGDVARPAQRDAGTARAARRPAEDDTTYFILFKLSRHRDTERTEKRFSKDNVCASVISASEHERTLMAAKMYYDNDADLALIRAKKVAIIGYGSQGHAHALNLKDSGVQVKVGLAANSKSKAKAEAHGLSVTTPAEAAKWADVVMILVPDTTAPAVYAEMEPHMTKGKMLMFAHGFNIRFGTVKPSKDIDVTMIAPKAPGHRVRELFVEGGGTPALIAVEQDATGNAKALALSYAKGIGVTRAGVIETTFTEETETDLFGEQAILCGGHERARQGRLRDAGQGRLSAGGRVLRVPPRAEAHRRSDVSRRHQLHAVFGQRHRRAGRLRRRAAHRDRRDPKGDAEAAGRDQGRHVRQELDQRKPDRPAAVQQDARGGAGPSDRDRSARSSASMMPFLDPVTIKPGQ